MRKQKGFTLIEVLVTVAIVGIIGAIAYPGYLRTIQKNNRAVATLELAEVAQRLQRCYSTYGRFDDPDGKNRCGVYETLETGAQKITTKGAGDYEIRISNVTATTYTLTATPTTGKGQEKDYQCSEFALDQAGRKTAKDKYGTANDKCW